LTLLVTCEEEGVLMTEITPVGLLSTPLYPLYRESGATKVVDFHGWALPVQFSGVIKEHEAVRNAAGLFDISHMGEIVLAGAGALDLVQKLTINDASTLEDGQVQYSAMCLHDGGIVDDITVYRFSAEKYLLCVNAANRRKDLAWIEENSAGEAEVRDESGATALLALQGPKAEHILKPLVPISLPALRYYHFVETEIAGVRGVVSRTGYTGEDGFELFLPARSAPDIWRTILSSGKPFGMLPVGLGARDTLRLEMKYALYGLDINAWTNPIEAGLGWITKVEKGFFFGRDTIRQVKENGAQRKLVGFEMRGRGVARPGYPIWAGDAKVGTVTSGTYSPSLRKAIGLGYVPVELSRPGTALAVEVREEKVAAEVVRTPFYRQGSVKK
jgi:aminomethyltransferase